MPLISPPTPQASRSRARAMGRPNAGRPSELPMTLLGQSQARVKRLSTRRRLWEERQRINDRRREQRKWAEKGSALSEDGRRWADDMLAEARRHVDMPGLRIPNDILLPQTAQSNLAICFPQVSPHLPICLSSCPPTSLSGQSASLLRITPLAAHPASGQPTI